ncbi:hypothetical protein D1007_62350 [Hordeum vulgare]|nr:hypothetical protein D1007_62350 [Hordeum vulgare]
MDISSKCDASLVAYHVVMRKITEALQAICLMSTQEDVKGIPQAHTGYTHLFEESDDECANEIEDENILEAELHDDVLPPNPRKKRGRSRATRMKSAAEDGVIDTSSCKPIKGCIFCNGA